MMEKSRWSNVSSFFLMCYLAPQKPTLDHHKKDTIIHLMLITALGFEPKVTKSFVTKLAPRARPSTQWDLNKNLLILPQCLNILRHSPFSLKIFYSLVFFHSFSA